MVSAIRRGDVAVMEREMFFEPPKTPCIHSQDHQFADHPGMFYGQDLSGRALLARIPAICASRWAEKGELTVFILMWQEDGEPPIGLERLVQVRLDKQGREGWCLDADDEAWMHFVSAGELWQPWRFNGQPRRNFEAESYSDDARGHPTVTYDVWNEKVQEWVALEQHNVVFTARPGSFILLRHRPWAPPLKNRRPKLFPIIRSLLRHTNIDDKTTLLEALPFAETWWTRTPSEEANANWSPPPKPWE